LRAYSIFDCGDKYFGCLQLILKVYTMGWKITS